MSICTICDHRGHVASSCPSRPGKSVWPSWHGASGFAGSPVTNTAAGASLREPMSASNPMKSLIVAATAALVTGCASTPAPTAVTGILAPSARLMEPPAKMIQVREGDDLVLAHLQLRRQYSRETSRLSSLQGYVHVLRGTRPAKVVPVVSAASRGTKVTKADLK